MPKRLYAPGLLLCGDGAGMVNIPTLKGVHYAIEAGRLAAETAFAALARADESPTALAAYDDAVRSGFIGKDLHEVRDMRAAFGRGFVVGAACAGAMSLSKGRINIGRMRNEADDAHELLPVDHTAQHLTHDGTLTFDRLSSVFAAGNKTRDDQPNHIRIQQRVPADVARAVGAPLPGAGLLGRRCRRRRSRGRRHRAVELRAVRRDLREGRAPDATRRWLRPRVLAELRRRTTEA